MDIVIRQQNNIDRLNELLNKKDVELVKARAQIAEQNEHIDQRVQEIEQLHTENDSLVLKLYASRKLTNKGLAEITLERKKREASDASLLLAQQAVLDYGNGTDFDWKVLEEIEEQKAEIADLKKALEQHKRSELLDLKEAKAEITTLKSLLRKTYKGLRISEEEHAQIASLLEGGSDD